MATAHIRLEALTHNLNRIRSHLKASTKTLAAVKANAYGHGAVATARHLAACGVDWFGVATAGEALELRAGGVAAPILIFSPVYDGIANLVEQNIVLTVSDEKSLEAIERSGVKGARVHLKVDTGMGRLGLSWRAAVDLARWIDGGEATVLEGVWSHFAQSDSADETFTRQQIEQFQAFLDGLERAGVEPELVHIANSAAIFAYPEAQFDMVRPGIALYGYHSSPHSAGLEPDLRPALTLSAPVTFVKRVKVGTPVSYDALWRAPRDTTVATVRIGYADGYPRLLTGQAEVLVQGEMRPVAGRICMDQLMVDVGELEPEIGERVTLFGPGPLDAEAVASRIGTISYELLVSLSPRVSRMYS